MWISEHEELTQLIANLKEFDSTFTKEKIKICNINDNKKICVKNREFKENEKEYLMMDQIIMKITRIESWSQMLEKVKQYIDTNKCKPTQYSKNSNIKIAKQSIMDSNKNNKTVIAANTKPTTVTSSNQNNITAKKLVDTSRLL